MAFDVRAFVGQTLGRITVLDANLTHPLGHAASPAWKYPRREPPSCGVSPELSGGHRGGHENGISGPDGTPDPRNHHDLGRLRGSDGAAQESNLPSVGLPRLTRI